MIDNPLGTFLRGEHLPLEQARFQLYEVDQPYVQESYQQADSIFESSSLRLGPPQICRSGKCSERKGAEHETSSKH